MDLCLSSERVGGASAENYDRVCSNIGGRRNHFYGNERKKEVEKEQRTTWEEKERKKEANKQHWSTHHARCFT